MDLLVNQTTNVSGNGADWSGGEGTVICEGTFDGATVTLEAQFADGDWVACGDLTIFTAAGFSNLNLGKWFKLRGVVTGAGAGTDVTLKIVR